MTNQNLDRLQHLLRQGPQRTSVILENLGISQPTFSRLWKTVSDGVVLGKGRASQYALVRSIPTVNAPIPLFRVSANGDISAIGDITPLQGEFYAFTSLDDRYELFQGIPFFLKDLRPQGFLGRMEPSKNPELGLPADILRWTDEQALLYIARRSENAAGDLVLGNESYARHLIDIARARDAVIPNAMREDKYPEMAEHSMQGEPPGSSAGGEQPKFTAVVQRDNQPELIEHVIVKFSPKVDTPSGRRWGDLLICEHLALDTLNQNGIAAARTSILETEGRIFLEVVRFDRIGLTGRRPMATFSALDGDLGMADQSWTAMARELVKLGQLSEKDLEVVEVLDLYGTLIGNSDKHHGNIALSWTFEKKHTLLDAYDMLPMFYRPNTHGEIVEREWKPLLLERLELRHLKRCYQMAEQFWESVLSDSRISMEFKNIVNRHVAELRALNI